MLSALDPARAALSLHPLFELRTIVVAAGREFLQLQLFSPDFVLTRVGDGAMLFIRDGGRRYTVDRAQRVLRPMDVAALWAASAPSRARTTVSVHDGPVEVEGYACRRLSIESQVGDVALTTESYYAAMPGVERTALHADRLLSAPDGYPAHLLRPGEVLVHASTVVRNGGLEQTQTSRLWALRADPEDGSAELDVLAYTRLDGVA